MPFNAMGSHLPAGKEPQDVQRTCLVLWPLKRSNQISIPQNSAGNTCWGWINGNWPSDEKESLRIEDILSNVRIDVKTSILKFGNICSIVKFYRIMESCMCKENTFRLFLKSPMSQEMVVTSSSQRPRQDCQIIIGRIKVGMIKIISMDVLSTNGVKILIKRN